MTTMQAVEQGETTVVHEYTTGKIDAVGEEWNIFEGGRFSDSRVARRKKRSHFGGRRFDASTRRGISKALLGMVSLAVLVISLVTVRFLVCLEAAALHKATQRAAGGGGTSRRLAGGQSDADPSSAPTDNAVRNNQAVEAFPLLKLSGRSGLSAPDECPEAVSVPYNGNHSGYVAVPMNPTTAAADGEQNSRKDSRPGWVPLVLGLLVAIAVSSMVAGAVLGVQAYRNSGDSSLMAAAFGLSFLSSALYQIVILLYVKAVLSGLSISKPAMEMTQGKQRESSSDGRVTRVVVEAGKEEAEDR